MLYVLLISLVIVAVLAGGLSVLCVVREANARARIAELELALCRKQERIRNLERKLVEMDAVKEGL